MLNELKFSIFYQLGTKWFKLLLLILYSYISTVHLNAQVEWPEGSGLHYAGCPDLVPSDFRQTTIQVPEYPRALGGYLISIEVAKDDRIFYAVKTGVVGVYDQVTQTHTVVGTLNALSPEHMGLQGLALHPDYPAKPWIYLHYTPRDVTPAPGQLWPDFRLSRFTLVNNQLDMSSETVMLEVPFRNTPDQGVVTNGGTAHQGGRIRFGPHKNLYIMTGDNSSWSFNHYPLTSDENAQTTDLNTSGNTNDFRGKVLRINPEDNGDYSIPKGNLWEYQANFFRSQGREILASRYEDSTLVKREVYAMGMRSPIAIQIDKKTGWVLTSEAGPNKGGEWDFGGDDFHLMKHAGNNGYPFFYGRYYTYPNEDWQVNGSYPDFDWNNPVNFSIFNTGVDTLPAAEPAIFQWEHGANRIDNMGFGPHQQGPAIQLSAAVGPLYWYDKDLVSDVKMPPHLNGKFFISNFYQSIIGVLTLNQKGDSVVAGDSLFRNMAFEGFAGTGKSGNAGVHDMFLGHHGELYISTYSGKIYRIDYVGNCKPDNPVLDKPGCMDTKFKDFDPEATIHSQNMCLTPVIKQKTSSYRAFDINSELLKISVNLNSNYTLKIYDMMGNVIQKYSGNKVQDFKINTNQITSGFIFVRIISSQLDYTQKIVIY